MAIEFEKQPIRWDNAGTEPSEDLQTNGFQAGYKPAAETFNSLLNNTSGCLTELQTQLSGVDDKVIQTQSDLETLDGEAIKEIKGNGKTITASSTGAVNITPNNIGAAASTHYHSASQINSGTLPIERGGTGGATADEARTNFRVPEMVTLYENESGSNGTITLSDNSVNYHRLEVTIRPYSGSALRYRHANWIDKWGGYFAGNVINMYPTSNNSTELYSAAAAIDVSGTTLTFNRNYNNGAVYICRVIGYKNLF